MEDPRIGHLLRELPRETAGAGFTARVLERLEEPERRDRPAFWQPRFVLAGALVAALVITAGLIRRPEAAFEERADAQRAVRELRDEHLQLQRELQALRELRQDVPPEGPVLYLGGNEEIDLVVDLGKVQEAEGASPAAYRDITY